MIDPECIDRARKQQPDLKLMPIIPPNTIHVGKDSACVPIHFLLECPDCENGTCDSCPLHHIWKTMPSQPVVGLDKPSKRFTSVPIPAHWRVQKSIIPGAGLGLFAKTRIPCGTRMGPYRGEKRLLSKKKTVPHRDMCYAWEIKKNGKVVEIVDGKDPKKSNFMRYINCACYETQQNMVAYQYEGQVYYRSVRDIEVGEELLVWYGHEYGKELGLLNTSMTMSLGPLKKKIAKPSKQNPAKNNLKAGGSLVQRKRRSQRNRLKTVPLSETDPSMNHILALPSLREHGIASASPGVVTLTSPGQNSTGQKQKKPVQSSITPPKKKSTANPRSPSLTRQEEKTLDREDTNSLPNSTSLRWLRSSQPTYSPSPDNLEKPVGAVTTNTRQLRRGTVTYTDTHRTKQPGPSLSPLSTSPVSKTTGRKRTASDDSQPEALAQSNKKSPSTSPLEKSISLILSSSTEGSRPSTHRASRLGSPVRIQGNSHKRKRRSNPRATPPSQAHQKPTSLSKVTSTPPIAQPQSASTPPYTECAPPVTVANSNSVSSPLTQVRLSAGIPAPTRSSSTRKCTGLPVATTATDTIVPMNRIKQEKVFSTPATPLTMGLLKQEAAPHGSSHCNSKSRLVVDNIHNCDVFLIIRPQSGAPAPATSYYCRVCNGCLVLNDAGQLAHSSTPLNRCYNNGPGTVRKSLKIPCVFCDDLLSSRGALYNHIKTAHRHKLSKQPYYCSICRKSYDTCFRLWRHLRIHLDVGPARGRFIKPKTPACTTEQKRALHQSLPLGRSGPRDPLQSANFAATAEPGSQGEFSSSDTDEIISVGSVELPPCGELTEEPFSVQKTSQDLRSRGKLGQPVQSLQDSSPWKFVPNLTSSDGSSEL